MVPAIVNAPDGTPLAVHNLGGTGQPALFVAGASLVASMFGALAHLLADTLACLGADLRGHGRSGFPPVEALDWHDFGRDLLAVVDGLDLERPVGIGHSAGGAALVLAELARPGTFSHLYLYEPALPTLEQRRILHTKHPLVEAALHRKSSFGSRAEAARRLRTKPPYATMTGEVFDAFLTNGFAEQPDGSVRLACPGEREALVYRATSGNDAFERLGSISCPVTIAGGTATVGILRAMIDAAAAVVPGCRLEWLDGLDHYGPFTRPSVVAASVIRALETART